MINKELLEQSGLLASEVQVAAPEDLVIVVRVDDGEAARAALAQVNEPLAHRRSAGGDEDYCPRKPGFRSRRGPMYNYAQQLSDNRSYG